MEKQDGIKENVNRSWGCEHCDESDMTNKEFVEHRLDKHEEEIKHRPKFPSHWKCSSGPVPVYLRMDSEVGPCYIMSENSDVEIPTQNQLVKHDWEPVRRQETPFKELEEGEDE